MKMDSIYEKTRQCTAKKNECVNIVVCFIKINGCLFGRSRINEAIIKPLQVERILTKNNANQVFLN